MAKREHIGRKFSVVCSQIKAEHPEWSPAQIEAAARASYVSADPQKRARSLANLQRGNPREKRKKESNPAANTNAADLFQRVTGWNIVEFATQGLGLTLYPAQEVLLRAIYGLALTAAQLALLAQLRGGNSGPLGAITEACWAIGARSGKSFMASIIALYEVTRPHWRKYLRRGETGYIVIIATRLEQARQIIQKNAASMILNSPLADMLDGDPTASEIAFKNGMKILSIPCNSTAGRGLPICCLILDEVAHFQVEGTKADSEIFSSLRPRLAQFAKGGAKTILISTPAAKQGLFWDTFKEGFAFPGRLTAQAPTLLMNPDIPQSFVDSERRRDPDNCAREFDAQFAERTAAFLSSERIADAMVLAGDLAPRGARYFAGIDQSGLSGKDRFALAVAHKELDGAVVIDAVRTWSSTDSDEVLKGIREAHRLYSFRAAHIDRYAGGWVRSLLEKLGLSVGFREPLPVVYSNLKSLLIAGKLRLPDNVELREGLEATRAFYGRNNSLSIDHERSAATGHGDLADAVATACWAASNEEDDPVVFVSNVFGGVGIFSPAGNLAVHRSGKAIMLAESQFGIVERELQVDPAKLANVLERYPKNEIELAIQLLVEDARFNTLN